MVINEAQDGSSYDQNKKILQYNVDYNLIALIIFL